MKKVRHHRGDSLDFYEEVRDSKRKAALKASLRSIHGQVSTLYQTYDTAFARKQLHSLSATTSISEADRNNLASLYSFDAAPLRKLYKELTQNEYGQSDTKCPFCEVNHANSFDHILPQSQFKEYATHPLNLIPCCTDCNNHKGDEWKKNGRLKYINLYQDDIPEVQFLFVELTVQNGLIAAKFETRNNGAINPALYERIEETYTKMQLCQLYRDNCADELMELAISIQAQIEEGLSPEKVKSGILKNVSILRSKKGYNYWKAVLKEECCKNAAVFQCLCTMK